MTTSDCYRILNLAPNASREEIRRAYLDLARVWHPDRFESDQRLRTIAENQLREINRAYQTLRDRTDSAPPQTTRTASAEPPRYEPPAAAHSASRDVSVIVSALARFRRHRLARPAGIAVLCLLPIISGVKIVSMFRVPILDRNIVAARSRAIQPRALEPMAVLDYSSDLHVAVGILDEWARGDVVNLWSRAKSAPPIHVAPAVSSAGSRATVAAIPQVPPANGSEFIDPDMHGAGELHAINNTSLEAIVFLVRGERAAIRAVYISPDSDAYLREIPPGVYVVHVELGRDLDSKKLRFQRANRTLQRFGPFQFVEIMSAQKSWTAHYEIKFDSDLLGTRQ